MHVSCMRASAGICWGCRTPRPCWARLRSVPTPAKKRRTRRAGRSQGCFKKVYRKCSKALSLCCPLDVNLGFRDFCIDRWNKISSHDWTGHLIKQLERECHIMWINSLNISWQNRLVLHFSLRRHIICECCQKGRRKMIVCIIFHLPTHATRRFVCCWWTGAQKMHLYIYKSICNQMKCTALPSKMFKAQLPGPHQSFPWWC